MSSNTKRLSAALFAGSSLLAISMSASPVSAQTAAASVQSQSDSTVQEVVITAERRGEKLLKVPMAVSVLTGQKLDKSTFSGVTEALNSVPGVLTTENYLGGGTTIAVRGVTSSFPTLAGSNAVAYYLDSVPFGMVRSAISPDADVFDLNRVEVLRGPQGTLYGSSALNGVVRILTNDPNLQSFDFKARLTDSGSSPGGNNVSGDVAVNLPIIQDKLAVRAVVSDHDDSGWIDTPNKDDVNDRKVQTYRVKVEAQPVDNLTIDLSAWISRSDSGAPSFGYTEDKTSSVLPQPIVTNYNAYDAKVSYQLPAFSISSATSYLQYNNTGLLGLDVPAFGAPNTEFFAGFGSKVFSEEVNLNSTSKGPWRWNVGAMYRNATEDLFEYYTGLYAGVPIIQYDNTSSSYAVYGEVTRQMFNDSLELTLGFRHFQDDESQKDQTGGPSAPFIPASSSDQANTPRVVLTWNVTDKVMAYASYSQGFRSGFAQTEAVLSTDPAYPATRPDLLTNYELGSKGRLFDNHVEYDASVYYIDWQNIQQQVTVPFAGGPGFPAIINGAAAKGAGADFALTLRPVHNFSISGDVSANDLAMQGNVYSSGVIIFHKGDRPSGSPALTAGATAAYDFGFGSSGYTGHLSIAGNYSSPVSFRSVTGTLQVASSDPVFTSRAAFTVDASKNWSATLFINNLNDYKGIVSPTFVGVSDWDARLRPRTIGVQLDYHYL